MIEFHAADHLGIGRLTAVVGASMGGMQALQWAVSHPARVDRVVAMTPMARTARWSQLVNELSRRALFHDAECRLPRPRDDAIRLWVPLTQLMTPRTPVALEAFDNQTALIDWLADRAAQVGNEGPDPFDWCYQSWAYDAHDVGTTPGWDGDTLAALAAIEASVLVVAPDLDLYNPAFSARAAAAAIPTARIVMLPGSDGHQSASGVGDASTSVLRDAVRSFLEGPRG